ncbi:hypothetical protein JR316_0001709 [Psilocybe cubensis]|uniref:Uncharacterized protein n=1 Tax=Psilocybe cubensis TaxID=181762 RepID=A0ACB8HAX5_PSICU|nr:hypothetical protein JR316_0001709 [Psilocybe cubensis]KAH9484807.1 hypothetical protein JR316_0001709 [Psilocybe cubensis]
MDFLNLNQYLELLPPFDIISKSFGYLLKDINAEIETAFIMKYVPINQRWTELDTLGVWNNQIKWRRYQHKCLIDPWHYTLRNFSEFVEFGYKEYAIYALDANSELIEAYYLLEPILSSKYVVYVALVSRFIDKTDWKKFLEFFNIKDSEDIYKHMTTIHICMNQFERETMNRPLLVEWHKLQSTAEFVWKILYIKYMDHKFGYDAEI